MKYITLSEAEIGGRDGAICSLWVEVDNRGFMQREIGLNEFGNPVHIAPLGDERGILDVTPVQVQDSDITAMEFQDMWEAGVAVMQGKSQKGKRPTFVIGREIAVVVILITIAVAAKSLI